MNIVQVLLYCITFINFTDGIKNVFYNEKCQFPPSIYPNDDYKSPVNFSNSEIDKNEVYFRIYTTDNICDAIVVNRKNMSTLNLDNEVVTKIVVHGWLSVGLPAWYKKLKNAYLKEAKRDYNIILVDWSKPASLIYTKATANTKVVGKVIAKFIEYTDLIPENVHLIGYSLGAHTVSFAAKALIQNGLDPVGRITGLDPAGPKFFKSTPENRLDKSDAVFVDIIHTDSDHWGYESPIGHVDYFPNGGKCQPGCPSIDEDDNCHHCRAPEYFIESINRKTKAYKFEDEEDILNNNFNTTCGIIVFGEHVSHKARGKYYLKTSCSSPYLENCASRKKSHDSN